MARDLSFLAPGWATRLADEFGKPYMDGLRSFLKEEYRSGASVFPPKDCIFRALKLVDYDDASVVILGQDPYHGIGQANGLAFAVKEGNRLPPSLLNIFKEIETDLGQGRPKSSALEGWAKQGVLLLNTVLTVRENQAFSHRNHGWEKFTDRVIQELALRQKPMVFIFWGSAAQQKKAFLAGTKHVVLQSPHPSPLSASRGFFGSRIFSEANRHLPALGQKPVDWLQA